MKKYLPLLISFAFLSCGSDDDTSYNTPYDTPYDTLYDTSDDTPDAPSSTSQFL